MRKFTFTKMFAFVLAFTLVLSAAGCGSAGASKLDPKSPVAIEIWHYYNGPQEEAFNALVNDFNETVGAQKGVAVGAVSQGDVQQLIQTVMDSAQQKVGAKELPDIFASYADNAFALDQMGLVAKLDPYMTKEELDAYIPGYLEEGRFDNEGSLKIFPSAKSTELLMLNQTDWNVFAEATGADVNLLATLEGVTATAKAYYEWTDSLTPAPGDGKAFFGRDSMANYMLIGAKQLGQELFVVENGKATLNADPAALRKLWDNFYIPYINGYFTAFGRFRSDDIKTGDIIAMVGSTSGAAYFPGQVTAADNSSYPIGMLALPAPRFTGSQPYAVQQGAGMVVLKSDPKTELAAVTFLKWFTSKEQNVRFSLNSGYLPVTVEGSSTQSLESFLNVPEQRAHISDTLVASLPVAFRICQECSMYTSKPFHGGTAARKVLEQSMVDAAKQDRERLLSCGDDAALYQTTLEGFSGDARFNDWRQEFIAQIDAALGGV